MATFIRIKRRLCDEPLDSILVRPKRRRVEGGATDGQVEECGGEGGGKGVDEATSPLVPPPTLLERVGTVESKDAKIDANLLREYKKGWELRQSYKRLGGAGGGGGGGWKEEGRKMAKERERESREMITNKHRGNNITNTGEEEEEEEEEEEKEGVKRKRKTEEEEEEEKKKEEEEEEEEKVHFFDAQISSSASPSLREGSDDIITCNGRAMDSEKYVYDIYYYPQDTDWSEYVFEHPKLMMEVKEEEEEEEDDENDEDNWRNDYPEEEEEEEEEEYVDVYGYCDRPERRRRNMLGCDTDESFDADDYVDDDECGFDEEGNLITVASLSDRLMVTMLGCGDDSD